MTNPNQPESDKTTNDNTPEPKPEKPAKTKPITIALDEDLHRKLRVVAIMRGKGASELVEHYVEAALRKDLGKALAKLQGE